MLIEPNEVPTYTQKGGRIPNSRQDERPRFWHEDALEKDRAAHPGAILRTVTAAYNCLGLVFASRRTWVEGYDTADTERVVQMILTDDQFRRVRSDEAPMIGDLVLYRDGDGEFKHIGTIANVRPDLANASFEITVVSKWGHHGEYIHSENDVYPSMGTPVAYYTDRK